MIDAFMLERDQRKDRDAGGQHGMNDEMADLLHVAETDYEHFETDEHTGAPLDPRKVQAGRLKEYNALVSRNVYRTVDRELARSNPQGKFIKTRWVKSQKGDDVRCRFVAQEFASGDPRGDLFAGTPPH